MSAPAHESVEDEKDHREEAGQKKDGPVLPAEEGLKRANARASAESRFEQFDIDLIHEGLAGRTESMAARASLRVPSLPK